MFTGPSLSSHEVVVSRQISGVDSEGTPLQSYAQIDSFRGGFGSVSTTRELVVGDQGQRVDAALSTKGIPNVMVGDLVNVAGRNWRVIGIRNTGATTRILLAAWGIN